MFRDTSTHSTAYHWRRIHANGDKNVISIPIKTKDNILKNRA